MAHKTLLIAVFLIFSLTCPSAQGAAGAGGTADAQENAITIKEFSISPKSFLQASNAEFSISVQSAQEGVLNISPKVDIYGPQGEWMGNVPSFPLKIAGGEQQRVLLGWESKGAPVGLYSAYANISYGGNLSALSAPLRFSILAAQVLEGSREDANASQTASCNSQQCSQWGDCEDGYKTQYCSYLPSCPLEGYHRIIPCQVAQPPTIEREVCASAPSLCTKEDPYSAIYLCLPPVLAVALFIAYLALEYATRGSPPPGYKPRKR
jgi:hypothetical protein